MVSRRVLFAIGLICIALARNRVNAQVLTGTIAASQTLLDLRLSHMFEFAGKAQVELLFDVLNALDDTSEERLADDNYFSTNFGKPSVFVDPRRAMLGVRLSFSQ